MKNLWLSHPMCTALGDNHFFDSESNELLGTRTGEILRELRFLSSN